MKATLRNWLHNQHEEFLDHPFENVVLFVVLGGLFWIIVAAIFTIITR